MRATGVAMVPAVVAAAEMVRLVVIVVAVLHWKSLEENLGRVRWLTSFQELVQKSTQTLYTSRHVTKISTAGNNSQALALCLSVQTHKQTLSKNTVTSFQI